MRDLPDMTLDELAKLSAELRGELEAIEEERMYVLSQTGLHVSAGAVSRFESEINDLKTRIEEAERALHAKKAE